jgi:hypothetical protein
VLLFGVMLILTIPAGAAMGQSTLGNYLPRDMNSARVVPILLKECGGPDAPPNIPCEPTGLPAFKIPRLPNPILSYQDSNINNNPQCRTPNSSHFNGLIRKQIMNSLILPINPQWAPVYPDDHEVTMEGVVVNNHVSSVDFPTNHNSHDQNFDVIVDKQYPVSGFNGVDFLPGYNFGISHHSIQGFVMENEWEVNDFDFNFWPSVGDRVWMMGHLIWDCGHPPYRIEIHPPTAVAFTHVQPTIFSGDNRPSLTSITHIFINGHGGYINTPVPSRQPYNFDIPLPPKPSPDAIFHTEILSHFSDVPNAPDPVLTLDANKLVAHVNYDLSSISPSPNYRFEVVLASGWKESAQSQDYHLFKITFDSIQFHTCHTCINPTLGNGPDSQRPFVPLIGGWPFWVNTAGTWQNVGIFPRNSFGSQSTIATTQTIIPENGYFFDMLNGHFVEKKSQGALTIQITGWNTNALDYIMGVIEGVPNNDQGDFVLETALANRLYGLSPSNAESYILELGLDANSLKQLYEGANIGNINSTYTASNNLGLRGEHNDSSLQNEADNTVGDFNLFYHIDKIHTYPKSEMLKPSNVCIETPALCAGPSVAPTNPCIVTPALCAPPPGPRVIHPPL